MKKIAAGITDSTGIIDYSGAFPYGSPEPPKTGGEDALFESLAVILPELNVKSGLARADRKKDIYFNTLRGFCEGYDEFIRDITRFMAEESWRDYSMRLRSLKDMLANIGNEHLSTWAHKLELASGIYNEAVCKKETESFCYAMYLFREKLAQAAFLNMKTDDEDNGQS
jgi:HPt (histidine-containing phosphotransfer) domain-containing protein